MALSAGPGMLVPTASAPVAPPAAPQPIPAPDSDNYSDTGSPPRQAPIDLPDPILEGDETESEGPIEPVTPTSGRQSQDFTSLRNAHDQDQDDRSSFNTHRPSFQELPPPAQRSGRLSTTSIRSTMTNFFRRPGTQDAPVFESGSPTPSESSYLQRPPTGSARPTTRSSRFSFTRPSNTTTRSNSPPSPGAPPLEMVQADKVSLDEADLKKKNRASTGFSLRGRAVNFVGTTVGRTTGRPPNKASRRANSFDAGNRGPVPHPHAKINAGDQTYPPERQPWAMPPDAGTGAKARRMSLSLPDDFNVDVAVLQDEFEYQSKLLGRHGKHLGKGAASKVSLMVRKGFPTEMYAVKEFRGKSGRESKEDYDKKIKSEFSIGKSLHHPNIVETIRLCSDHGRWNHVMEYCSEGDLFSLVQKGHLKGEAKLKDRLCLFKQLIQGVNYLHANGIAHRDIKLENLLITKDSKLKITDFGVSEVFCGTHPGLRESGGQCGKNMGEIRLCRPGICGSEPYIAPEVLLKNADYDPRALDVWSAAIVMIYMTFGGAIWSRAEAGNLHYDKLVTGWNKWNKKHEEEKDAVITDTDYPNCYALDVGVNPPALRRILLQMLNPNPNSRISIYEVITNRWVKNIECCQLESYDDPKVVIDVTKKDYGGKGGSKIFCHNHLPPKTHGSHSLGKMPGQPGY
ncbi:hypothetical protein M431DRAFT_71143 [Trichoderma harzianum CBS 226.95]|uniref:Protein kinase domain-containing protein n=1 Tax=Trichoderma harzianum CBS 226.95 TaxID=983964 RepID=A0A2T4ATP7_TRIHA|nr:hypothetical protein M431DRAFT_71143 [Trichoderma harzianum CBS 226.95]PTB60432.1 hypothetical protein M431DRAFT_71143 [Trichoderma harzianum CBS 226.95]